MSRIFTEPDEDIKKDIENEIENEIENDIEEDDKESDNTDNDDIENAAERGKFKLRRPIEFEGAKIEEIDISGLQEIRGKDIEKAMNLLRIKGRPTPSNAYMSVEFLRALMVTKLNIPESLLDELYSIDYLTLQGTAEIFLMRMG